MSRVPVRLVERAPESTSAQDLETARRLFVSAHTGRAEIPNGIARLAAMELRSDGGLSAGILEALDRARTQVPGRHDYTLLYAQALARQNDFSGARAALLPLDSWTVPAAMRDNARSLREFIDRREAATKAAAAAAAARGAPADPARPPTERPSQPPGEPVTRPIFRPMQDGEVRVEGLLERIECVRGTGVVFHLKTPDGPFAASAPQFGDVDFITYRSDLSGGINCGPLKEPLAVYVTWKPVGPKAESRRVVAIEFLPKR